MWAVANGAMIRKDGVLRVQCVSEFIRRKFKSCLLYSYAAYRQDRQVLCGCRSGQPSTSREEVIQGVEVNRLG